jgi:pimeloyl-ACP methyl ester carboxylesterase
MTQKTVSKKERVVLLHGIARSKRFMGWLSRFLKSKGYDTVNITYPSRHHEIKDLTIWLHKELNRLGAWEDIDQVHFVVHSMGGLVGGFYLQDFKDEIPTEKLGRVVMLGTPNGGSEITDNVKDSWWYRFIFGPAGQELTTQKRATQKVEPFYELGILAGNSNWLYPFGRYFPTKEHDGCVSVEHTKLDGMKDHIILPVLHGDMGWDFRVRKQVLYFLNHGEFNHAS